MSPDAIIETDSSLSIRLREPVSANEFMRQAWLWAKARLMANHRLVLELREETRSDAQNRLLHSRINDVAKQCTWAGSKQGADTWKRLFTSAWFRTQGLHVEVLPALDGHGVDIVYASTTKLSRKQCAELSEFVMAWGDQQGVEWCIASLGGEQ
jgi:hypothetical protein